MQTPPTLRAVLAASSFGSAAIGFGYGGLFGFPALRSALAESNHVPLAAGQLAAALLFASAQTLAGVQILRGQRSFLAWLAPAAVYLFAIGVLDWLRSGHVLALGLDSARGLWLLVLGCLYCRALGRSSDPG